MVVDSMCSMLSTVVVRMRSKPVVHLYRIQAGELPGDSDHWNIDIGKDIRRGAQDYHRASQQNEQRQNDECIGTIESDSDYPHIAITLTIIH
jgi:hypothetical protein